MKIKPIRDNNALPKIIIDYPIMELMNELTKNCDTEVSWLGLVKKTNNIYRVYGIEMCDQECEGAYTGLFESGLQEIAQKYIDEGDYEGYSNIRMWIHSHVDMEPTPSGTDEKTFKEYYKSCGDYFIRMIMNKKGKYTLSLADVEGGYIYDDLTYSVYYTDDNVIKINAERIELQKRIDELESKIKEHERSEKEEAKKKAKELIKEHVKKTKSVDGITNSSYKYYNGYYGMIDDYDDYEYDPYNNVNEYEELYEDYCETINNLEINTWNEKKQINSLFTLNELREIINMNVFDIKEKYEDYLSFRNYKFEDWKKLKDKCEVFIKEFDRYLNDLE